ncbi:MAG: transketolase [SAR202 cluster bacterium]|nr:transketolase [SAR202 cluster bacterium]|tara:strand:+ start:7083 stop:9074 length:1992 start_codon:yes stop_codon:yes gene_type:complete
MNIEEKCINALRFLSIDQVNKAASGHPGAPMGAAVIAYVLFKNIMNHNPDNPNFINRDRFILSIGHASALLYSVLHLSGYKFSLEDLKNFRQLGSITPGHPERDIDLGIEVTTGPLGQGFANGVGMAISEKMMAQKYSKLINHFIYGIVGDGDLQEGISSESASLAGTLGLGKLIYIYDSNGISIDGSNDLAFTENVAERFKSYNWHVIENINGNDIKSIQNAIEISKNELSKPSLIIADTTIGFGSPNKAGSESAHGEPLGEEETSLTRDNLGWDYGEFEVPEDVVKHMKQIITKGNILEKNWEKDAENFKSENPDQYNNFLQIKNNQYTENWDEELLNNIKNSNEPEATRASSGFAINLISNSLDNLIGGSADLTGSTNTLIKNSENFSKSTPNGKNIKFGVREHGMGGVMNGISAYGSHRVFGGTFLVFSDYMRASIRLSALSKLNSIWIFTHDSIGLGEDGPTHQPISQLMSLRSIPNLNVFRPADRRETLLSWRHALNEIDKPSALIFSRQSLPDISTITDSKIDSNTFSKGAFSVYDNSADDPEIILISTGSELSNTIEAAKNFDKNNSIRVISMPCWELFDQQDDKYQKNLIPEKTKHIISVEAGVGLGWQKYTRNNDSIISMETFGASAPGNKLIDYFGFSADKITDRVKKIISE